MIEHDYWLDRLERLRVNPNPRPAPHKPLLLLYALGRLKGQLTAEETLSGREHVQLPWREVHSELDKLLHEHTDRSGCMFDPFWRLQNDDLWVVVGDPQPSSHTTATQTDAVGSLEPTFEQALVSDPSLLEECAAQLLDSYFEPGYAAELRRVLRL